MRQALALALLLTLACASGSIQSGVSSDASTEDFDVAIRQDNAPLTMAGAETADVLFVIRVKNLTAEPWTIERIALQSMGRGAYTMPVRTREFARVLAPGSEEEFEFWGTVNLTQDTILTRAPITMRAKVYAKSDGGSRREEDFLQRLNGRVTITPQT